MDNHAIIDALRCGDFSYEGHYWDNDTYSTIYNLLAISDSVDVRIRIKDQELIEHIEHQGLNEIQINVDRWMKQDPQYYLEDNHQECLKSYFHHGLEADIVEQYPIPALT